MDKVTYLMYESSLKEAHKHLDMVCIPSGDYNEDEESIQELIGDALDAIEEALDGLRC